MRLTRLKLAGFKSFVDPTTVLFPGQLAGVVGPNGCGKSNVIDAVRWVLGESKASELRGESIQDVIFKGSGTRKEVGRASVELFFDNTEGRAGGQWRQYAEITVKRVLDRQGNSNYYINTLHVRRRDVIDLFLGTGMGPRAYAIIGQGMISRIVEAKPDELRFFLEEAAGVTKYKERRRETESRLTDARENIARVNDIRLELEGQIAHLETQAAVARQYQELNTRRVSRQNLLWLKKRNEAEAQALRFGHEAEQESLRVEAQTAQLREMEARVEGLRQEQLSASDALHAASSDMHLAAAEVRRLEAEIKHVIEARARLDARLQQLSSEDEHWQSEISRVAEEELRWQSLLDNSRQRAQEAQARYEEVASLVPEAETAVARAHQAMLDARATMNLVEQNTRLAEADRNHAARALENLTKRRARLEEEQSSLTAPEAMQLAQAEEALKMQATVLQACQERLGHLQERLPTLEEMLRTRREKLQSAHRQMTEQRARHDALVQLQSRVAHSSDMAGWLKQLNLTDLQPLWQVMHVEAGWETAVEALLRERLSALMTTTDAARQALISPPPVSVALTFSAAAPTSIAPPHADSLRSKVHCKDAFWSALLDHWLEGVTVCHDLAPHIGRCTTTMVSSLGHVLSAQGLVLYAPDARTHGVLERQREIDALVLTIATHNELAVTAQQELEAAEQSLADLHHDLTLARSEHDKAQQAAHAAQVVALQMNQLQARFNERAGKIAADLAEIAEVTAREMAAAVQSEHEAARSKEQQQAARISLDTALAAQRQCDDALREARAKEAQLARAAQDAGFSQRECTSKLADNARANETAQRQHARVLADRQAVLQDLASISDVILQDQLQSALGVRAGHEDLLTERREQLEAAAAHLRQMDEQRLQLEQGLQPARERIGEIRLKEQAAQMSAAQYTERLVEGGVDHPDHEAQLAAELNAGTAPKEATMANEIARLNAEIEALGAVNMAAFEELKGATERKSYLDSQSDDLNQAIATLEDAIRRIDQETREQLQETYDAVNRHFGELFPQLFGGGEAKLLLTGEEILDAGIQIMAQPPGKKNTTIHLLSGGEKALTAIALVFALFQLNPAPFCMLDEVDAPLDDSNTVRFCELVKKMSVNTQFIFISHNKIAMEMAQQLIGVTMQERGVSRIVEVDIQEALRMTGERVAA